MESPLGNSRISLGKIVGDSFTLETWDERVRCKRTTKLPKEVKHYFKTIKNKTKLLYAKELLERPLPIKEVAKELGYNYNHFCRWFKEQTSKTANQYRKKRKR